MRFLVLGASGMAGHTISLYLKERGHDVMGLSRKPVNYAKGFVCDVRDTPALDSIILDGKFDVIVNAVGILNQFAEENPTLAVEVNAELPWHLAELTANLKTRVIHMSTDCVFAGNTGPYTEDSVPDGESVYDKTKAQGELNDSKNLTLRNSIVGPDVNPNGIGLFNWFMKQDGAISGYTRALWTGMTTCELARCIEHAAVHRDVGLVNMVPSENISKYELLLLFNEFFRCGSMVINENDSVVLDKTLIRTNFSSAFRPKSYREQIKDMASWVAGHRELYPHYVSEVLHA